MSYRTRRPILSHANNHAISIMAYPSLPTLYISHTISHMSNHIYIMPNFHVPDLTCLLPHGISTTKNMIYTPCHVSHVSNQTVVPYYPMPTIMTYPSWHIHHYQHYIYPIPYLTCQTTYTQCPTITCQISHAFSPMAYPPLKHDIYPIPCITCLQPKCHVILSHAISPIPCHLAYY
jgi:hypothetical protein